MDLQQALDKLVKNRAELILNSEKNMNAAVETAYTQGDIPAAEVLLKIAHSVNLKDIKVNSIKAARRGIPRVKNIITATMEDS